MTSAAQMVNAERERGTRREMQAAGGGREDGEVERRLDPKRRCHRQGEGDQQQRAAQGGESSLPADEKEKPEHDLGTGRNDREWRDHLVRQEPIERARVRDDLSNSRTP
jgi:hypothetical protein